MSKQNQAVPSPLRSSLVTAMLILGTLLSAVTPTVQAVGPNQNDLNSGGDLPDNTTVNITNYIFSNSYSGSGELDYGDDSDYLRVALSSTQGLSASLSFPSTTTFANGTTVTNDFDLIFYDASLNYLDDSYQNNPETLTTNTTSAHGGMVYIEIARWSGSGSWNLTLYKFTASNGTGGGGGGGTSITNCTGAGTVTSDILEPNDATSTASGASLLPLSCTGLSIHSSTDVDYFEVDMIAGVTYYANISFTHANGDIDVQWESSTGSWLTGSGGTSNLESMQYTSSLNQTTYINVYGYSSATNTYDIEITTDNPGGGQSFETVEVFILNTSQATLSFSGLTNNTSYNYNYSYGQMLLDDSVSWANSTTGTFNTTGTTHSLNISIQTTMIESVLMVSSTLSSSSGSSFDSDMDEYYIEMVQISTTSSTTGDIELTNLTVGTDYAVEWIVIDFVEWDNNFTNSNDVNAAINASMIDSDAWNLTPTTSSVNYQVNWTGPTT
ncbi:MAG: hypothetical protein ACPGMW_06310, partial [Poseidonia sp.]